MQIVESGGRQADQVFAHDYLRQRKIMKREKHVHYSWLWCAFVVHSLSILFLFFFYCESFNTL